MKVSTDLNPGFKPFTMTISVETQEEFEDLWCRFNASAASINNAYKNNFNFRADPHACTSIWTTLDSLAISYGYTCRVNHKV